MGEIDSNEIKAKVIRVSWDNFVKDVVTEAHSKYIVVIVKEVAKSLSCARFLLNKLLPYSEKSSKNLYSNYNYYW